MDESQQKHQKVYSFLKRVLPQERYERIRAIEPCIIVANGFNKAFKFAILGDDRVYITENPPKVSKDVRIVIELSNVTDIKMIHDVPEFLGGDLKNQTQHILITYKCSSPLSPQSRKAVASPIPEASSQGLASSLMTASALLRLDYDKTFQPSTSGSYTERTTRDEVNFSRKLYSKSNKMSVSEGNIPQLLEKERLQASEVQTVKNSFLCVPGRRPLPPPPVMTTTSSSYLTPQQHRKTRRKRHNSQDLNSSSSSNELDFSSIGDESPNNFHERKDYERQDSYSANDSLERKRTSYFKSRSVDDAQSLVESLNLKQGSADSSCKEATEEIHLYILEQGSLMFVMVKSTWNNCIMKSTFHYGEKSSTTGSKVDNSQLLTLFNQLKTEILHSQRIENTFVLVNELLTAALKSFALKKYFWQSPELFQFIVDQIRLYLPHSPSRTSKRRGNNRNDEFDFVVVLLDCLVCMFRETEILMSRWNVLKENKGKAVKDLLECILATPTKSHRSEPKISQAAQLLLMGSSEDLASAKKDEETNQLLNEITDCSTAMLFELVLSAHQALNFAVENNTLNICWLVKVLESSMSIEMFVERMMERKMAIISSCKKRISPKNAVLLYRQLYILHNILDYSDYMATAIPRSYAEEFRYYIKASMIRKNLPLEYPLTLLTLTLLDKVTAKVLKNKPRVSFSR